METELDLQLPRNHGFAVVRDNPDGTKMVMVCDEVTSGEPQSVYAVHYKCSEVHVHPGVAIVRTRAGRHTRRVVEVFAERPGVVHLKAPPRGDKSLLGAQ